MQVQEAEKKLFLLRTILYIAVNSIYNRSSIKFSPTLIVNRIKVK